MKKDELTIQKLKNTDFPEIYKNFLLNNQMYSGKYLKLLSLATLFINCKDENIKKLGYRIIVIYSNQTMDYKPLYEISVNLGLIPISHFIEKLYDLSNKGNVFTEINAAIGESFFIRNVYCSLQQKELIEFYNDSNNETVSIIAPTSYGKTDLIMSTIEKCKEKNICVITPTKSLLAQTKMRVLQAKINGIDKIITHPEMYNGREKSVISILTQERLLRLLKKTENLSFDYVIVDEAHGLLRNDERNILLASVILILEKRNPNVILKFLTPFLCDPDNMKVRYADYSIKAYNVSEYIKTEKIYMADFRHDKRDFYLYDQFLNQFYSLKLDNKINDIWTFIKAMSTEKNIIYFNKPKDIEYFLKGICSLEEQKYSKKIEEACDDIAEYVHPKYFMIDCLKHGVIYHHGSVPEPIRIYIEKLYSELSDIKYVVTSSTLLEGVNLPADNMFILDNRKGQPYLSPSNFKNLIGRVCRFSQVFHPRYGSLKKLEPNIYVVGGKFFPAKADIGKFIRTSMNVEKKIKDKLENVLLQSTKITNDNDQILDKAEEFIENYESGIIKDYKLRKVRTEVGKSCFVNNITEFDIFQEENQINYQVKQYQSQQEIITETDELFDALYDLFFSKAEDDNVKRFQYQETRNFYKMFMDWRITNAALNYMVNSFIRYWKGLISKGSSNELVYVGNRWGDEKRDGFRELWTNITQKSETELINLAIVRIKEEQDFLDNTVIKYIEVLHDMQLLEENLYLNIKYGTCDKRIISCLKNGISLSLAKLLVQKYLAFISIDIDNDLIQFNEVIVSELEMNNENKIMIQELKYFL